MSRKQKHLTEGAKKAMRRVQLNTNHIACMDLTARAARRSIPVWKT